MVLFHSFMQIAGNRLSRSLGHVLVGESSPFVLKLIFRLNISTYANYSLIIGETIFDKCEGLKFFA